MYIKNHFYNRRFISKIYKKLFFQLQFFFMLSDICQNDYSIFKYYAFICMIMIFSENKIGPRRNTKLDVRCPWSSSTRVVIGFLTWCHRVERRRMGTPMAGLGNGYQNITESYQMLPTVTEWYRNVTKYYRKLSNYYRTHTHARTHTRRKIVEVILLNSVD